MSRRARQTPLVRRRARTPMPPDPRDRRRAGLQRCHERQRVGHLDAGAAAQRARAERVTRRPELTLVAVGPSPSARWSFTVRASSAGCPRRPSGRRARKAACHSAAVGQLSTGEHELARASRRGSAKTSSLKNAATSNVWGHIRALARMARCLACPAPRDAASLGRFRCLSRRCRCRCG